MSRRKIVLFRLLLASAASSTLILAADPDQDTNEIESEDGGGKGTNSRSGGTKKDLKKDLKYLKLQYDEMFQEMKNQNHAILKQADHSRILSLKVVNMTAELSFLSRENNLLREKVDIMEFKLGKRLKKLKSKSSAISTRLGERKRP